MATEYKIDEQTGVDTSKGVDPSDWETIPLWVVFRYDSQGGWQVGKYRDKRAAEVVRAALDSMKGYEY